MTDEQTQAPKRVSIMEAMAHAKKQGLFLRAKPEAPLHVVFVDDHLEEAKNRYGRVEWRMRVLDLSDKKVKTLSGTRALTEALTLLAAQDGKLRGRYAQIVRKGRGFDTAYSIDGWTSADKKAADFGLTQDELAKMLLAAGQ